MQVTYDYYRIFYYVAKYKSFTAAAAALLNSQPNVTRTVKSLEATLGCTLFVRSSKGVVLTPEGQKLYDHVKIAFEHLEAAEEEISMDKTLHSGIVSIGASEVALHCFLLPILKTFREKYTGVRVHITNHSTPQALNALKNGLVDIAVVTTPTVRSGNFIEKNVKTVHEVAVCSNAFKELLNKDLTLPELSSYPIISLENQSKTYEFYSNLFAAKGITFAPSIEAATTDQVLPLVQSDLGIGFVPEEFIRNADGINILKLKEKIPSRHICLVKRRDQQLSIAAKELERLILKNIDV